MYAIRSYYEQELGGDHYPLPCGKPFQHLDRALLPLQAEGDIARLETAFPPGDEHHVPDAGPDHRLGGDSYNFV